LALYITFHVSISITLAQHWLSMARQSFRVIRNPFNIYSSRGLHTQSFAPRASVNPQQPSPFASRVIPRTRAVLNVFVGHLTAPSTLRAPGAAPRSVHLVTSLMPAIENNSLSLPVRHALSVRMGAPRLPLPPAVPRSIAQVGLGTARNLTTGRPGLSDLRIWCADKLT
jgi:hypothetical protein